MRWWRSGSGSQVLHRGGPLLFRREQISTHCTRPQSSYSQRSVNRAKVFNYTRQDTTESRNRKNEYDTEKKGPYTVSILNSSCLIWVTFFLNMCIELYPFLIPCRNCSIGLPLWRIHGCFWCLSLPVLSSIHQYLSPWGNIDLLLIQTASAHGLEVDSFWP